jgi:hypothetical protein
MALNNAPAGGDHFSFDICATEGALVAFRIREHKQDRMLTATSTKPVSPVEVDLVVLTGSRAKTVVRGEEVIGSGITTPLRKIAIGDDVVCHMAWGKFGSTDYVQANPASPEEYATAEGIFTATNGDPYTASEAARPAAVAPVQVQPPAPVAPAVDPAFAAYQAQQAAAAAAAQVPAPVAAPPVDPAYAAFLAQQAAAAQAPAPAADLPAWAGPQPVAAASGW